MKKIVLTLSLVGATVALSACERMPWENTPAPVVNNEITVDETSNKM